MTQLLQLENIYGFFQLVGNIDINKSKSKKFLLENEREVGKINRDFLHIENMIDKYHERNKDKILTRAEFESSIGFIERLLVFFISQLKNEKIYSENLVLSILRENLYQTLLLKFYYVKKDIIKNVLDCDTLN